MFEYLFDGKTHTDTSDSYLAGLGMSAEQIESVQRDAGECAEQQWCLVRTERAKRMSDIEWRLHRMYREEMLGMPRSDSEDTVLAVHRYMQELADITEQPNPFNISWPEVEV